MSPGPRLLDPRLYWDGALKFSQILPDFQSYLTRMAEDSRAFSKGRDFRQIKTGANPRQWVEWTDGTGTSDVIPVIIHGGYWRALNAEDHRFLMPGFAHLGPVVASVEYRLKPKHALTDCVDDVVSGLNAITQAFPGKRLFLIGHSAGAHLALCASDNEQCHAEIAAILALSGVYDLAPVAASSLQDEIALSEAEVRQFSLSPANGRPPCLFVNGQEETRELIRGSALMATQPKSRAVLLPGANHMTLTWAAAEQAQALVALLDRECSSKLAQPRL